MIKVTIKGPRGSGKTTVANILKDTLKDMSQHGQIGPSAVSVVDGDEPFYEARLADAKAALTGRHDVLIKVKSR